MKTKQARWALWTLSSAAVLSGATLRADGDAARGLLSAAETRLAEEKSERFAVVSDKPLYHPGETVWFRAFELATKSLSGVSGDHGITFQLIDPAGSRVMEKRVLAQSGVAMNDFALPAGMAGGSYVIRATSDLGFTTEHPIVVSTYELPQIKKQVDFTKKSYRPGDTVSAIATLESATGEPLKTARTTAVIQVDDRELARFVLFSNERGKVYVRFDLPRGIKKADASLTLIVDGGGPTESIQRRIPVLLDDVTIGVYPEGGDLVTGLTSRVYIKTTDSLGKPADVEGSIVDDAGMIKATFKSFHAGMARATFTPDAGKKYRVRLSGPARQEMALPDAKAEGCVMASEDSFGARAKNEAELGVQVRCTSPQTVFATAVLREKAITASSVEVKSGAAARLALPLGDVVGAVRVTLFDATQRPLAERVVYRGLGSEVNVSVTADKASYSPRDPVTLTVTTTNAKGAPVAADVALSVVDDTVLSYADDKTGHLLSKLYIESEMPGQKVFEPNFYFSKDKKAPEAMDLLMGTAGWRRFDWRLVTRN